MDDKSMDYINGKFKELNTTLRTAAVVLTTILISFAALIGISVKTAYANKIDVEQLKIKEQKLESLMVWSLELSEIQRDYIKTLADDGDVSKFLDKFTEIENRIYGIDGRPSFRGNSDRSQSILKNK